MRSTLGVLLLILLCTPASTAENLLQDSVKVAKNAHLYRNLALGNMVGGSAAYFYFANTWGAPTGKFHLKDEIHDNLNGTDEHSHLFAGYKLTEGFRWLFRLLKVEPQSLDRCAAIQAALVVTLVEFPMDAYNPTQGLGATDLVADYAGVGLAILKHRYPNNFDMKMSAKRPPWDFENKFLSSKNEEFDNFIWWGTWKPKYVWLGVGYSTNHFRADGKVSSEVYLSIGTTLYDLLHLGWPQMADEVKSLDTYFICLKAKVL